jgi:endonuclease/exonuclease/phosphatase family metal-dependent hydrolase
VEVEDLIVATYNVHRCIGIDGREDVERVAAVIRELAADVIGLQEVAPSNERSSDDQLVRLARASGLRAVAGPLGRNRDMRCCNALLSRGSASSARMLDLSVSGHEPRSAIDADVDVDGSRCRVLVTHLGLRIRERRGQLKTLLAAVACPPDATLTVILGDLNEWLLPMRVLGTSSGFGGKTVRSFPALWPILSLDQVLARPASAIEEAHAHVSPLARTASDHLPVRAVVTPIRDATAGTRR